MTDRYQVMPDMSGKEYEQLKRSIERDGVLAPVVKDAETGEIIDGFHRLRAAEELGIEAPIIERTFEDDADRENYAITVNLVRRQLGPVDWGKAFERLLKVRGIRTGSGRQKTTIDVGFEEAAEEQGVHPNTARNRMALAEELDPYPIMSEWVDAKKLSSRAALEIVREYPHLAAAIESGDQPSANKIKEQLKEHRGAKQREEEERARIKAEQEAAEANGQMTIGETFEKIPPAEDEEPWPEKPERSEEEKRFYQISQWFAGLSRLSPEEVARYADDLHAVDLSIDSGKKVIDWFERYVAALEKARSKPLQAVK